MLRDGRSLRVYDSGGDPGHTVLFHAGSPHTGELLEPLLRLARQHGVRLLGYARPSYGGSTPQPGRTVASAAADVAELAAALDLRRFAVLGYSGGGPHALACAARLPDRVAAVACLAGVARTAASPTGMPACGLPVGCKPRPGAGRPAPNMPAPRSSIRRSSWPPTGRR